LKHKALEIQQEPEEFETDFRGQLNTVCTMRTLPNSIRAVGIGVCDNGSVEAADRVLTTIGVLRGKGNVPLVKVDFLSPGGGVD
jgi:hypothetical protein